MLKSFKLIFVKEKNEFSLFNVHKLYNIKVLNFLKKMELRLSTIIFKNNLKYVN